MSDDETIHVTTTEARGGSKTGVTRYILAGSLLLVIVAFAIIVASGWMG